MNFVFEFLSILIEDDFSRLILRVNFEITPIIKNEHSGARNIHK